MRALITGANGFAGTHLVRLLLDRGWELLGITDDLSLNPHVGEGSRRFALEEMDICDREKMFSLITDFAPEYVFHLAAITKGELSRAAMEELFRVNVSGTQNLLFTLLEVKSEATTLIAGSSASYGASLSPDAGPIGEGSPLRPRTPYGASKLAQETFAASFGACNCMKVVITRAFNYTGPGEAPHMACSAFARQIAECEAQGGGTIEVGNLDSFRDYSDVRDVVRAYLLAATRAGAGDILNVCSGTAVQMSAVLARLVSMAKVKVRVETDPARYSAGDATYQRGDSSRIRAALGWEPEISFEKTLCDLLEHWRERLGGENPASGSNSAR